MSRTEPLTSERVVSAAAAAGHRPQWRTDIQALRAVAVVSVVLFHLWPKRVPGGFVGVDVFFVISGYLIIGHLLRDVEQTGRLHLARFWAARARRLLPASLLTLSATIGVVLLVVPRSLWDQFFAEIMASAAYVQNWQLAASAVDYFGADNPPSPVKHFWSLAAEEQFYVFLPVLIWIVAVLAQRTRISRVRAIQIAVFAVSAVSFIHCVRLTGANPQVAYFSTFTRMWEFGLGGIAAFAAPSLVEVSRRAASVRTVLTLLGGCAIAASLIVIDTSTPFPGLAATLPALGAAAMVRWGGSTMAASIGARQPVAMLGRTSYALYLWHWPLIILVPYVTLHGLNLTEKVAILGLAVALSWASTRWVEEPIRFSVARRLPPRLVFALAAATTIPVVLVSLASQQVVARERSDHAAAAERVLKDPPACLGAASMDPERACVNPGLHGLVVPNPTDARHDRLRRAGCNSGPDSAYFAVCASGPKTGYRLRLAVVGDSHARSLLPAIDWIANKHGWRIDTMAHAGCYWTTAAQRGRPDRQKQLCADWQRRLAKVLGRPGVYDAIITTHATAVVLEPRPGLTEDETAVRGMVEAWNGQTPPSARVIAIVDNPRARDANVQCVERWGATEPDRCAAPREWAMGKFDPNSEAVSRVAKASLVDLTPFYCNHKRCPAVIGGVMVYRDKTHVTATFMRTLAPYLDRELVGALRDDGAS